MTDLQRLVRGFEDLVDASEVDAADRVATYDEAIANFDAEWEKEDRFVREHSTEVVRGLASDDVLEDFYLAQARKRRLKRARQDSVESRALAMHPEAEPPTNRIAVGSSTARIE